MELTVGANNEESGQLRSIVNRGFVSRLETRSDTGVYVVLLNVVNVMPYSEWTGKGALLQSERLVPLGDEFFMAGGISVD